MTLTRDSKHSLVLGSFLLGLAVMIGAFGAHGLKNLVEPRLLETFETGVRYHFYHGFGLLFLGLLQAMIPNLKTKVSTFAFVVGILLFSFNCYFYVISGTKIFAMIVPLGGVLFILGWMNLSWQLLRLR
ncbi:MAG: DUF423 domain-containing protein [Bacteriovoracaceae bacterium]|jgi:uncharacterized membrane protein YgdD (TMEM256/DUF423 family)